MSDVAKESEPEELQRDIEQTRGELGDTVEALSQKADVKAQVSKRIEERTAGLRARRDELRKRQEELKAKVAETRGRPAGETPLPIIGVAFGAGVLLGWLIKRS
jgi:ElaB/YqjD/DUF883 family membrane-anchored ribosome-binding protein